MESSTLRSFCVCYLVRFTKTLTGVSRVRSQTTGADLDTDHYEAIQSQGGGVSPLMMLSSCHCVDDRVLAVAQ